MTITTSGLHHVTAIAGRPQANIEYYVRLLGLRLIKRTVNYDDPLTYHLYFGDALGNPGSVLTFFPWPGAGPAERGSAETTAITLRVPAGGLDYWRATLSLHRQAFTETVRLGESVLSFTDPDGVPLELVEGAEPPAPSASSGAAPNDALPIADILRPARYWSSSPVASGDAIIGIDGVTLSLFDHVGTAALLTEVLGYTVTGSEDDRTRLTLPGSGIGARIDLLATPRDTQARLGTGSVHHVAFRLPDRAALDAAREELLTAGLRPTKVKNRLYFQSVYFTDPAGTILELATDGPGFTVDEPPDELGLALKLPEWLEAEREYFRSRLPVTASPEYADRFG